MIRFFIAFILLFYNCSALTQTLTKNDSFDQKSIEDKPAIDIEAIKRWKSIDNPAISDDGKYFSFKIINQPVNSQSLILKSTIGPWEKELSGISSGLFMNNNKEYAFWLNDTLYFLSLGNNKMRFISNVTAFDQAFAKKGEWFIYRYKSRKQDLVLENVKFNTRLVFDSITNYISNSLGTKLLLQKNTKENDKNIISLELVNLKTGGDQIIWTSKIRPAYKVRIIGSNIDDNGEQIVFLVETQDKNDQIKKSIWYFKAGMKNAMVKVTDDTEGIDEGLSIYPSTPYFGQNSNYIMFQLQEPELPKPNSNAVMVDIWSYNDTLLQSEQLLHTEPKIFYAVISRDSNRVIRLIKKAGDYLKENPNSSEYVIIGNNNSGDRFWLNQEDSNWLVSLKDGSRRFLLSDNNAHFHFSPGGKYLVYYSSKEMHYYSMDLNSHRIINISEKLPAGTFKMSYKYYEGFNYNSPVGIAGWTKKDSVIFVYDNWDIWQLDLSAKNSPKNVTNAFGKNKNLKLRFVFENLYYSNQDQVLLTAFDPLTKNNGFFYIKLGQQIDPIMLTMGPYTYYYYSGNKQAAAAGGYTGGNGMVPLKAKHANVWVVKKQHASEAPNFFLTTDFKNYRALSNLQPHRQYNWLTAELINWTQPDGVINQGVLYKPENFNNSKKYPIIFSYYRQRSDDLNGYPKPAYLKSPTKDNIAWFVSHGYLVFTPDFHYKVGEIPLNVRTTLESAARYLGRFSYVDTNKMGLTGHSWSGHETNWIISQSTMFTAAATGAGVSDDISNLLQLSGIKGEERSGRLDAEFDMGASIWENQKLYLNYSPVLKADKIATPLLIFHNEDDGAVPWAQGVELFIALRRLGKKVWMLQYDKEQHGNYSAKNALDLTIRLTQFFDHYLKDEPAPLWMSRGIPARLKGLETGYRVDSINGINYK